MALPFYNQGDQDIYAGGEHFIPQEQYRLNYTPSQSLASTVGNTGGVTGAQAANPYIWPPQGGGGGGGGGFSNTNKFGLNLDTMKTITSGQWVDGNYEKKSRDIAQDEHGNWKDVLTNQNPYHANIGVKGMIGTLMDKAMGKKSIPGVPDEGSWTGAEWDDEFDPTVAGKKQNMIQRWKAKKEFKAAQAQQAAAEKARADIAAAKPSLQAQSAANRAAGTGGWQSGMAKDAGFMSGAGTSAEMGSFAQGGRIGYEPGGVVEPGKQYYGKEDWEIQQINQYGVSYPEFLQNQFGKGLHQMDASEIALAVKAWDSWRSSQAQGGLIGYFDGGIARLL